MVDVENFGRRLLLSIDATGYGSSTDRRQAMIQSALLSILDSAARTAGLSRSTWLRQASGDGELAILPESEPEPRLVDDFVRHLYAALTAHNDDLRDEARLRLRLAIHYGVAQRGENGYVGQGVVAVSRLVECPQLKAAMSVPGPALAVLLSNRVYIDTVAQEHTTLSPELFRRVEVRIKEYADDAWLYTPDYDVHSIAIPPPGPATGAAQAAAPSPSAGERQGLDAQVVNNIENIDARNSHIVFGISNRSTG